jgi:hypothetical protein
LKASRTNRSGRPNTSKTRAADRYKTQAERALKRALNNVGAWQKTSQREADRERRNAQWQAEQAVPERRVTLQEQKFRFAKYAVSSPDTKENTSPQSERSRPIDPPVLLFGPDSTQQPQFGSMSQPERW